MLGDLARFFVFAKNSRSIWSFASLAEKRPAHLSIVERHYAFVETTMPTGDGFSVERYALGVYNELLWGLTGLVEEG